METVTDQVTSIQRQAAQDELAEDLERLYARLHALLDAGNSEQLKLRSLDYAWLILTHGEAKTDKVVQTVVMDHGAHS